MPKTTHDARTKMRAALAVHPTDIDELRNQLADFMEEHPPDCWSGPFIVSLLGLFHGHSLLCSPVRGSETNQRLRIVT